VHWLDNEVLNQHDRVIAVVVVVVVVVVGVR